MSILFTSLYVFYKWKYNIFSQVKQCLIECYNKLHKQVYILYRYLKFFKLDSDIIINSIKKQLIFYYQNTLLDTNVKYMLFALILALSKKMHVEE